MRIAHRDDDMAVQLPAGCLLRLDQLDPDQVLHVPHLGEDKVLSGHTLRRHGREVRLAIALHEHHAALRPNAISHALVRALV